MELRFARGLINRRRRADRHDAAGHSFDRVLVQDRRFYHDRRPLPPSDAVVMSKTRRNDPAFGCGEYHSGANCAAWRNVQRANALRKGRRRARPAWRQASARLHG
jgi:hypothetical protein